MPALDPCHDQIVRALQKAGWTVSPKSLRLDTPLNTLFVDIIARSVIDRREIIIVEAKCFSDDNSAMHDLYVSLGQYLVHRDLLTPIGMRDILYLAVPTTAYANIFEPLVLNILKENEIKLITVNLELENEEIERWTD